MMNEMKKVCKLIQYGYNFKVSVGCGIVFVMLGVVFSILGSKMSSALHMQPAVLSTMYVFLGPLMALQVLYTLLFSEIVKSSPRNYTLEVLAPNLFATIMGVFSFIFSIISALIGMKVSPDLAENYYAVIMSSGIMLAGMILYFGVCYKYFVLGTIGFIVGFLVIYGGLSAYIFKYGVSFELTMVNSSLIGGGIVAAGIILSCVLRKLLYKKPISKYSAGAYLKKAMV